MGRHRILLVALASLASLLAAVPAAQASFHFISIREAYPGSAASPDSGYVELQMYAAGQQFVGGHALTVYDAGGSVTGTFTFPSNLPNGADQQTILIGDSGVQGAFGVAPDLSDAGFALAAAGGAACWGGTVDCVSWGGFTGSTQSPTGTPADAGGIPDGMALRRSIAPGCPTLLEAADDSNGSAADFLDATPQPRNNAGAIVETVCGPPPDTTPPSVTIDSHPADPSPGTSAAFKYHASEAGSSFECSLAAGADADNFSFCSSSGKTYTGLADGPYTFRVRATDAASNQGAPTAFEWTVDNSLADTTPPDTAIDSAPPDPSTSSTAFFAYHSTEPGSRFECRLDGAAFAACAAGGIEYTGLANGSHSFLVRAIDPSDNTDPTPAGYSFEVAAPTPPPPFIPPAAAPPAPAPALAQIAPPPNTRIVIEPRRRTRDRTPTLRFRASVGGARFQCSVDRVRFRRCRSPYTTKRLRPGRHRIRVRAVAGGVVDPTPASSAFRVVGRRHRRARRR